MRYTADTATFVVSAISVSSSRVKWCGLLHCHPHSVFISANMVEALIGKWNFQSVENVDAYLDALGVSDPIKEMVKNLKPVVEISRDGNAWLIKTVAGDKTSETKLVENQEVDSVNLIGQQLKATLKIVGDKLVETQKFGDLDIVIERRVEGGIYHLKMQAKGVDVTFQFTRA